ncbi:hypothetical protein Val02_74360 [Virgisporangium aliadipatigenens]|uniref:Uncharacterized protein n=1 Tax=Virgisporangium aliadipatigenens TaxID=741659 RepID=A0A8J3YVD8_9ACTN|nr:hypothetical protein Val02_74360 [Virgisporangium aliadipatigenens]
MGTCAVAAFRDSSTEAAGEPVAVGAAPVLDGATSGDDSALEAQPAIVKTSSSAPIAVRIVAESGQCGTRGV